jgi:DNA-binding transcriptional LysR family regulator
MVDLNQVCQFVHVVRARSFAEAARRLRVPSNTLSRQVRQLESGLQTRLLQRSTRKLTLTAAGAAFYERCADAVDRMLQAGEQAVGESQVPSGSVRVAAPADFLDLFHIDWVSEFLAAHPRVRLDFVLNDGWADLVGESIDVAFRGGAQREGQVTYRQLSAQHFLLVASPAYLKRRGVPARLKELEQHACLTVSGRTQPALWELEGPEGAVHVRVSGPFAANGARLLLKGCVAGMGIALLPGMLITPELVAGRLVQVLPQYRRGGANFCVVLPSRRQIPPAVAAFVDFAAQKLESLDTQPARRPRRSRR